MTDRSMETQLAVLSEAQEIHIVQFEKISTQLGDLDTKLDSLLLREAERKGESAATKRISGYVSAVVSMLISVAGILFGVNVGK